ncbi:MULTISPECIES: ABC transporter substrate-binding protein [Bradyrhizobium]|uniref:ABC transporter permease n=3 Tax=Bradyrhizobium TaxID=374 RepID=A0A410VII9_9BRAD|nr:MULTISPECIES: ABC transporter substrate-binding protein [Bradyrhizobium]MCG2628133.1 ABC transporter substrate-binding protein [Bradyrhizobium zhengyangense]MCG2643252.1 ABC transporter substrate-binding protein [Bradyrhizobium zhengyangense]MCG2670434.1 ABC transporter substrate-binding protein [Bradyrhizobium zhengyangense]MDN4985831.1 ABC transporter substrate-binding protein [Bradyrhizobium sp. WYCCWR 13022]MDN5002790.1 ABC transporter substrate-binding protein [Bradyrhizobium sp. WYCCW
MRVTSLLATCVSLLALICGSADAQETVKLGVLNDQSGAFASYQGIGSVIAAQLAVEDYGGKAGGRQVEVVSADHQNKSDTGVNIARRWYENEGVDAIFDVPNSAIALAVAGMSAEKNKVFVGSGAGTALLTGEKCTPNTVHWTYDTYAYGRGLGKTIVEQGGKKWFFITADYAFGHDLEKQASESVKASGGQVLGAVRHPLGTADFASFLLQAQASGADIIGIANAGDDTITSMKQAAEFGLTKDHKLVGLILGMNGIPSLGLQFAQGAQIMNPFYWDLNEATRSFAKRFSERIPSKAYPNDMQAGVYAGVIHYLKAVDKVGGAKDGRAVVAAMKELPTDDSLFGKGFIRKDGRKIHPLYLLQVKSPDQSKSKWDLLKVVGIIKGEDAFRPENEGNCPLSKQ